MCSNTEGTIPVGFADEKLECGQFVDEEGGEGKLVSLWATDIAQGAQSLIKLALQYRMGEKGVSNKLLILGIRMRRVCLAQKNIRKYASRYPL